MKLPKKFTINVEKDEAGFFIASIPEIQGCHTQARSLPSLWDRLNDAILVCID